MRVLYVVSLFPCWSETFIVREIIGLRRRGFEVHIISLKPPQEALVQEDAALLLPLVIYPPLGFSGSFAALWESLRNPVAISRLLLLGVTSLWSHPIELLKSCVALWRASKVTAQLRALQLDGVHAHWATYPSSVAMLYARQLGIPFSMTCHAHDIFVNDHFLLEKIAASRFTATISDYNVRFIAEKSGGAPPKNLAVVHCGVKLAEFPLSQGERSGSVIVSVGRLDAIKGFPYLLKACWILKSRNVPFTCQIIGAGPDRAALERQIGELDLAGCVELLGAKPQREVRAAMASASVFVLPSIRTETGDQDGIPVALMEAMAAGLPVVSTRVSGIPELIQDQINGLLVPERDADALANALGEIMGDADLRARLTASARRTIEADFDADVEAGKIFALMSEGPMKPRLRVLLLTDELEVGGSQRQIVSLAKSLPRDQFEVQVAYFRNASYFVEELRNDGIAVTCIAKNHRLDLVFVMKLRRFLRTAEFDVVHAFSHSAEFWGALAHTLGGSGALLTSVRNRYDWYSWIQWRAKAIASWRSRLVVANSRIGGEYAVKCGGVPASKLRVVHNGVRVLVPGARSAAAARSAIGVDPARPVIMFVGRLVEQKNLTCLLRAFSLVMAGRSQNVPVLVVIGDGPLKPSLQQQAAKDGIEANVLWLGERSDVDDCLPAATVVVQSSFYEGLSNSLLEAMASGAAVVATDVGGTSEFVVDDVNGFLVPSDDHVEMAERISRLLDDPVLAQRLGSSAARCIQDDFSVASMRDEMAAVYREAARLNVKVCS